MEACKLGGVLLILLSLSVGSLADPPDEPTVSRLDSPYELTVPHVSIIKLKPDKGRKKDDVSKIADAFTAAIAEDHGGKFKLTVVDRSTIALQALSSEEALVHMVESHEVTFENETYRRPEDSEVSLVDIHKNASKTKRAHWFAGIRRQITESFRSMSDARKKAFLSSQPKKAMRGPGSKKKLAQLFSKKGGPEGRKRMAMQNAIAGYEYAFGSWLSRSSSIEVRTLLQCL
eukprot:gene8767-33634_t